MAAFASTTELGALLQRDLDDRALIAANVALNGASAAIRNYTRQTLSLVTNDVATLRGNAGRKLLLPERPVVSVASVVLNQTPIAASAYLLVRDTLWWGAQPIAIANAADDLSLGWGSVSTPITVTYTHGYAAVPDDIKTVCLLVAARLVQTPVAVASETIGGYSVTYGESGGGLELSDDEQAMLKKYRRTWL